jgi:hypothetical protein
MDAVYGVVIGLAVVVALLGLLVIGLLRSHADILRRLESLGAGLDGEHDHGSQQLTLTRHRSQSVSDRSVSGVTPDGEPLVVSLAASPDPTLIAFLSTTCSSCTSFWEGLSSSLMHFGGHPHRVLIVTLGESEESPTRAQSMARGSADVVMSSETWSEFEVPGAPYFVLLEGQTGQIVGEGSAMTYEALEEFLRDSTNDRLWDRRGASPQTVLDEESRINAELRDAGIRPNDPRLYPSKDDAADWGGE